MNKRLMKDAVD